MQAKTHEVKSRFLEDLLAHNRSGMEGFKKWVFHPGMLFNSWEKWWGGQKNRASLHEGLDLCCFEDLTGEIKGLDRNIFVPATFAGEIVKIEEDFLGQSIFVGHEIFTPGRRRLYTAYGHTRPLPAIRVGQKVAQGEIIAAVSDFPEKRTPILPHLHLTFAWVPFAVPAAHLTWQNLGSDPAITLIDPLAVLTHP